MPRIERLVVDHLHQPAGWLHPGYVEVGPDGRILGVHSEAPAGWAGQRVERFAGFGLPGMPNLHSHAFQRALVGRTERTPAGQKDSFWSWRSLMYQLASRLDPDTLGAVAALLYAEMLEAGMTSVGEFHYVHHDPEGRPYADPSALSLAIFDAAERTGIGLCHLPVYYETGGFGRPAEVLQRRFVHRDPDAFLRLYERLAPIARERGATLGVAPHSLRAVPVASWPRLLEGVEAITPGAPIHLHVAEQEAEVEQALLHLGKRPVEWLLDNAPVGPRWCLVHATQLDAQEQRRLAKSGAIVGLCPTTEANLGDGIFPATGHLEAGGQIGIGSDSHASISVGEELRLLEYGQRLRDKQRNLLGDPARFGGSVGRRLFDACLAGGTAALQRGARQLAIGEPLDLIVLDPEHPRFLGHDASTILDAWIFGSAENAVSDVFVGGHHVVRQGRHVHREALMAAALPALAALVDPRPTPGA